MFDKWRQYSYAAQKYQRHRTQKTILTLLILYVLYNCICTFLFSVWVLENDTMQPSLAYGDRIVFTSFAMPARANSLTFGLDRFNPVKRGNIVLVDMGREKERSVPLKVIDGAVRFFTAQKVSIFSREGQYYIKRVIALPGDEISMSNFMFRVKTSDTSYSLTEYELSEKPYHPTIPQIPSLWDEAVPFSGNMDAIVLGPDECFVVSDDRSGTNDSRTWGSIPLSMVTAKAVLRFWPPKKIELL